MKINVAIEYEIEILKSFTEEQINEFVKNFVITKTSKKEVDECEVNYAWRDTEDPSYVLYGSIY